MSSENRLAVGVDLNLSDTLVARPLQTEVDAADA